MCPEFQAQILQTSNCMAKFYELKKLNDLIFNNSKNIQNSQKQGAQRIIPEYNARLLV